MSKPKILFYDIETAPNLAYVWGKWQQDVIAFKEQRSLLSFAYSWHGASKVYCITREGKKDDKVLVKKLAKLLQEADIVVAHNGDSFDRKIVKARMIYWNLPPLKQNCSVDTKKVAKTYFSFNGNSLADLVEFLGIGAKAKHPGFPMWVGCMKDDPESWEQMAYYNKMDVTVLKKLYERFLPWIENHPNLAKMLNPKSTACPSCTSTDIMKFGTRPTPAGLQQRMVCKACNKNFLTKLEKEAA